MIIVITCVIAIAVLAFVLGVRVRDLPVPEPESPFQHLDQRKAAIYENLRDLQFEYRVGKLSDADYTWRPSPEIRQWKLALSPGAPFESVLMIVVTPSDFTYSSAARSGCPPTSCAN
jgi:hypothetical protein